MFCPNCGAEYREGLDRCADCAVELVESLPEKEAPEEAIRPGPVAETVFDDQDATELAIVESLLRAAEIELLMVGAGLQELFGAGRLGVGFNLVVGPVRLQVPTEDAERARQLLSGMSEQGAEETYSG